MTDKDNLPIVPFLEKQVLIKTINSPDDMQAYRIHKLVIAADMAEEACDFFRNEIGGIPPDVIEELPYSMEICGDDGRVKTIKAHINEELDARNAWLIMGIPCELHRPFVIGTLP